LKFGNNSGLFNVSFDFSRQKQKEENYPVALESFRVGSAKQN
jgi:hypothetical protein